MFIAGISPNVLQVSCGKQLWYSQSEYVPEVKHTISDVILNGVIPKVSHTHLGASDVNNGSPLT